jgi:peptidoglycan/xylan/chitin deacetylase (PgdA/CDA1 family)
MKRWLKHSRLASEILRVAAKARKKGAAVLFYHSIMEDPAPHEQSLGEIIRSTKTFRQQMEMLAREYRPVSLDDVSGFARDQKDLPSRAVVVTFDDGYADNLEVAAPILNRLGIPSVVYVTVDCVERQLMPWPARLRYACLTTKKTQMNAPEGGVWSLRTPEERTDSFNRSLEHCARLSGMTQETYVAAVERELEVDSRDISKGLMMTWDQMRQLRKQGHTIGSHTMTHPNIAYVSDGEVETELGESKRKLEAELHERILHFAYPGPALRPNWSQSSLRLSRELGYQTATTVEPGVVRAGDDPLRMRRIGPGTTIEQLRWKLDRAFVGN